jgi:hypothetical protein
MQMNLLTTDVPKTAWPDRVWKVTPVRSWPGLVKCQPNRIKLTQIWVRHAGVGGETWRLKSFRPFCSVSYSLAQKKRKKWIFVHFHVSRILETRKRQHEGVFPEMTAEASR